MSETECMAYNIAVAWYNTAYTRQEALLIAELQGVEFSEVELQYGNIYSEMESLSNAEVVA